MDCDVIVIGAGLAGLTAANRAAELGLSVMLLERQSEARHVCASRTNGGVFHVGFRSVHAAPETLYEAVRSANEGFGPEPVARALADEALRGIDWLKGQGTEFTRLEPDHGWKDEVLAPVGFHDKTEMAWQGLGADRLIARLEKRLVEQGGRSMRGVRARSLVEEDGRIVGVRAEVDGQPRTFHADAVVLADGGFEGNADMVRQYITAYPEHLLLRGCESGLGDGIRMAEAVGARLLGMSSFYGHILSADSLHREGLSPFPFLEFLASAGMLVDRQGDRFVDETMGGHYTSNALARQGDGLGVVLFDHAMWEGIGRHFFCPPNPNLVNAGGTLHRADSIEDVARLAGLPPARVRQQMEQLNQETRLKEAAAGSEEAERRRAMTAYAKGKHPHEPFEQAPFYAAPVCAALTSTLGGVEIDAAGRVIDVRGVPIAGLYAAGSCTGGVEGGPAVGYIGGLIKALVFGLAAAEHIARENLIARENQHIARENLIARENR